MKCIRSLFLFGVILANQFMYINAFKLKSDLNSSKEIDHDQNQYTMSEITYSNENNYSIFTNQTDTNIESWELIKKVLLSLILIPIMIITLIGNLLVILAVLIVRKLHTQDNANNILIVSLAVSDLLVGAIVMPFGYYVYISNDNKWYLGAILCDLWTVSDVLMCTASILNLVAISVDRYFIILHAMVYTQKRNAKLMLLMILIVWCISAVISIPPIFGWGKPSSRLKIYQTCQVSTDLKYQIYATVFSFYLPATVMIIIYIAIFRAASQIKKREMETSCRAQLNAGTSLTLTPDTKYHQNQNKNSTDSSVINDSSYKKNSSSTNNNNNNNDYNNSNNYLIKNSKNSTTNLKSILNIIVNPFDKRDTKNKKANKKIKVKLNSESDQSTLGSKVVNSNQNSSNEHAEMKTNQLSTMVTTNIHQNHSESHVTIHALTDGRRNSIGKRLGRRLTQAFSGFKRNSSQPTIHGKNQKATRTLGVIMGCFMLCWLPFFILALIKPIGLGNGYSIGDYVPQWLDGFLLWLGYFNSALNPMIYARFNREFRKPFVEILCFRCRGINSKLRDDERKKMFDFPSHGHSSISHANIAANFYSQPAVSVSNQPSTIRKTESIVACKNEPESPLLEISVCKEQIEKERNIFFYGSDKPPSEECSGQFVDSNNNNLEQRDEEASKMSETGSSIVQDSSNNTVQHNPVQEKTIDEENNSENENADLEPLRDLQKKFNKIINSSSTRSSVITNDSSFFNDSTSSILQPLEDSSSFLSSSYLKSIDNTSLDSKNVSSLKRRELENGQQVRSKSKKTDSSDTSIPSLSLRSSYSNATTYPSNILFASNENTALSESLSAKTNSICENSIKSETSRQRKLLNSSNFSGSNTKINLKQKPLAYCTNNKQYRSSASKANTLDELKSVENDQELECLNDKNISDV